MLIASNLFRSSSFSCITTSSVHAPTLNLSDLSVGSFWVPHGVLVPADDLDLDFYNDLHLEVGFDLCLVDLPKVHVSLDRFFDDFLHVADVLDLGLFHVVELRHHHVDLEEHHPEDPGNVAFVQEVPLLFLILP